MVRIFRWGSLLVLAAALVAAGLTYPQLPRPHSCPGGSYSHGNYHEHRPSHAYGHFTSGSNACGRSTCDCACSPHRAAGDEARGFPRTRR